MVAEATSDRPGGAVVVNRLADVLLVQALRTAIGGEQCAEQGLPALADPPIAQALALMHQRPAEPWTVEKLASAVGLSRSGFAARFTALVGEPPLEYLGGWRMTKAARLLRESDQRRGRPRRLPERRRVQPGLQALGGQRPRSLPPSQLPAQTYLNVLT
jgi:AraC-like DNA-binding protein